ncbi:MAG: DoxX family protein [Acidobacteria bacterium]|nr:DoxX family protein [Acidobacteriota bacterium]MBI3421553.1 DoxX family protein [Acidobacteriota bacterium]
MTQEKRLTIISWGLRLIVAGILFQTLFFKFSAAPESVYIFKTLGLEPWGRLGSGVVELIAVVLLLIPATVPVGALLSLGVISGALMSHLTKLGIAVVNSDGTSDGGLLFGLALIVFAGSLALLWLHRQQIPVVGVLLFKSES